MSANVIDFPERDVVKSEALSWPETARRAIVTTVEQYANAAEMLKGIKALRVKIAETFDPHVKRAHEAHKALVKEKADAEAPLAEAELILKRAIVAFDAEQERLRQIEIRRQQEIARQEEEQRRLDTAVAMEAEAQAFGDASLQQEAEELLDAPMAPSPVFVERVTPKVSGIAFKTTYSAEVTDLLALVKHVANNPGLLPLLSANLPALNAQARSLKAALVLPGVRVVEKRDVAAGTR